MAFNIYHVSIPVLIHGLRGFAAFLEKGKANATERNFPPSVLIESRLAPDMIALPGQIKIACDIAKLGAARLAGIEPPSFDEPLADFDALQDRIAKTIAFLETITEAQLEGAESRDITLKFPNRELNFTGLTLLNNFVLPNFYFHKTTAYNILRHNGVPLGKFDFLG